MGEGKFETFEKNNLDLEKLNEEIRKLKLEIEKLTNDKSHLQSRISLME